MPKTKRNRNLKRKRNARSAVLVRQPNAAVVRYTGPISAVSREASETTSQLLIYETTLTSTAGGVIANVFGSSPASSANWSDTNTVWGEFRTLGFKISYFPNNRYSKTTTTCRMLIGFVDRRNNTAASSYSNAVRHESSRKLSLEDPWVIEARMDGIDEGQYAQVGAPNDYYWIKFYSDGLTVSTEYGLVLVEYLVQFRNVE